MEQLTVNLKDVRLEISVLERNATRAGEPYQDWLVCQVQIQARSFSGTVRWNVMPLELRDLARLLSQLYSDYPKLGSIAFEPMEPNIRLHLQIRSRGQISGTLTIVDDLVKGEKLECDLDLEQSQLPEISEAILKFVGRHATVA